MRRIVAGTLERFVVEAALRLLENLDVSGQPAEATALAPADSQAIEADERELADLKDMWDSRELTTREYRQMRKTVEDRINAIRARTVIRPTVEVLEGILGSHARARWQELETAGNVERMNAILRFLFAAVIIDEFRGKSGTLDYDRVDIEPNPL